MCFFQEVGSEDTMPSRRSSAESPKPRRGRARAETETPPPKPTKKVNGSLKEKKEDSRDTINLSVEVACRLCDKKDFNPVTEALAKHYATAHFKALLEAEVKDNNCNICKAKKLRSVFSSKREMIVHLATAHARAEHLLSDELGIPVEVIKTVR